MDWKSNKRIIVFLCLQVYIDELLKENYQREMLKEVYLTTEKARQLREIAGQLNWTSSQTRPYRSHAACEVNVSIKDVTIIYLI